MQEPGGKSAEENTPLPSQEELARIVATMDSDEHIKQLAEKLFSEWKQRSESDKEVPDLSFATFAKKLKPREDQ